MKIKLNISKKSLMEKRMKNLEKNNEAHLITLNIYESNEA